MNNRIEIGKTAEILEIGNNMAKKLYFNTVPVQDIKTEFELTKKINNLDIPTATCYDLIQQDERYAMIIEKINGISMLKYMTKRNPFASMEMAAKLALLHVSVHTIKNPDLSQNIDQLRQRIDAVNLITDPDKNKIYKYLQCLPKGNSLCHGDYHPGNIILSTQGDFIVDWMTATQGHSCSDVARTDLLLRYGVPPNQRNGIEKIIMDLVRNRFADVYLNTYIKNTFVKRESISDWTLPHMASMLNDISANSTKEIFLIEIKKLLKAI